MLFRSIDGITRGEVHADVDMAVAQAESGAHLLGPSGMMDGQVGVLVAGLPGA